MLVELWHVLVMTSNMVCRMTYCWCFSSQDDSRPIISVCIDPRFTCLALFLLTCPMLWEISFHYKNQTWQSWLATEVAADWIHCSLIHTYLILPIFLFSIFSTKSYLSGNNVQKGSIYDIQFIKGPGLAIWTISRIVIAKYAGQVYLWLGFSTWKSIYTNFNEMFHLFLSPSHFIQIQNCH